MCDVSQWPLTFGPQAYVLLYTTRLPENGVHIPRVADRCWWPHSRMCIPFTCPGASVCFHDRRSPRRSRVGWKRFQKVLQYLQLHTLRKLFPGVNKFVAYTATATVQTRMQIKTALRISKPKFVELVTEDETTIVTLHDTQLESASTRRVGWRCPLELRQTNKPYSTTCGVHLNFVCN